jgi:ectoine hydroxylase-related dioxygenase (phytanoyl-CoA dioxygenase family)
MFPVRGILFDKIPEANWKVPWHQDVTIAVQEKIDSPGFGPWSKKADVVHVQPPTFILEKMVSVRFHIDDCSRENGALRVIPGSHRLGRIPEERIPELVAESSEQVCEVGTGGAMVMRPLLLHASSPSITPKHRRVVHIDFASVRLPGRMRWLSDLPSEN